ncbi:MAG: DUF1684 domain-containing protein [Actinomycetota bacterium]
MTQLDARPDDVFRLLDWRRRVSDLYREIRECPEPEWAWRRWIEVRREMFAAHPQSPIPEDARNDYQGPAYFSYDPSLRTLGEVVGAPPERFEISTSGDDTYAFTRTGVVRFELEGRRLQLDLYWLEGYGGGLFLPFRDATAGDETYGAGRYLYDTVKGADLGLLYDRLVLDFNFAYNPSCSYDPRWVCPLAPPSNRIDVSIRAGERHPS